MAPAAPGTRGILHAPPAGIDADVALSSRLFPFQRDIVQWALRRGRAAIFAGTGLGKSLMELAWADAIVRATGRDVLILAPLADMLNALGGDRLVMQVFSALMGVGIMAVLAAWLDWNKRLNRK